MAYKSTDEYISSFPAEIQEILQKTRETIKKASPEAIETMGYGVPSIKLGKKIIYFAAFKAHLGIYPSALAIERFKEELSSYETAKGTIRFPLDKPVPYELIGKIAKFMLR